MARGKGKFDARAIADAANKSDSNDSDYDDREIRSRRSFHGKRTAPRGGRSRPKKRQRHNYSSGSDIVQDSAGESEEDFEDSEAELEPSPNIDEEPGRRTRRSKAGQVTNYRESSGSEIEESESENQEIEDQDEQPEEGDLRDSPLAVEQEIRPRKRETDRTSLLVTLKLDPAKLRSQMDIFDPEPPSSRTRNRSRSQSIPLKPVTRVTRRTSRLSQDDGPSLALNSEGEFAPVAESSGTSRYVTRSGKGPARAQAASKGPAKKVPSAVLEVSQENSQAMEPKASPKEDPSQLLESIEARDVDANDKRSPEAAAEVNDVEMAEEPPADDVDELAADDEDEGPVTRRGRALKAKAAKKPPSTTGPMRAGQRRRNSSPEDDFQPDPEEEESDISASEQGESRNGSRRHGNDTSGSAEEEDVQEELRDLRASRARRRVRESPGIVYENSRPRVQLRDRKQNKSYKMASLDFLEALEQQEEQDQEEAAQPRHGGRRGAANRTGGYRSLLPMAGPFGGHETHGADPRVAAGGADSDSSDDELVAQPYSAGGPLRPDAAHTAGGGQRGLIPEGANQGVSGGPTGHGRVNNKNFTDADPVGVDSVVGFDQVGGLEDQITKLKEMVLLPLLYPEIFRNFKLPPPRGVLFHGPPGTGKTLLARALANSVTSSGRKVTFYMRKGADALSKWVGEAERGLRLLFEEAKKNQPSIIFFDEIDGLAPVRSSKQDQIHSSIVTTLLALMDGMENRGQVVIIGATNRPDSVDPALRRPGRFDREYYFPLPNRTARRAILDIHTKDWKITSEFKDQVAELTKGYGGADLRALCTEAALNSVQGTYPQIYQSDRKLLVDPNNIRVTPKDFLLALKKMTPSSERQTGQMSSPLPKSVEPLLRSAFQTICKLLDQAIPPQKKRTVMEEAEYDDRDDPQAFEKETMFQDFQRSRIYRPRLLIKGERGMGQQYLGAALLHKCEQLHVQSFDLPTILEDSNRSPEAAIISLFKEIRQHKPSVIYIPHVDIWYETMEPKVIKTFCTLLRSLPPNDPVLLLGIMDTETESDQPDPEMMRDLFGFSSKCAYDITKPDAHAREQFFESLMSYVRKRPSDFPDPDSRKKRKLPELPIVEETPVEKRPPSKRELKEQKTKDRHTLNLLKLHIQPIMDNLKKAFKRFRNPIIEQRDYQYLVREEHDPHYVTSDVPHEVAETRIYEVGYDKNSIKGIKHKPTGRFYYCLGLELIEQRLSNGYYKRPKDFLFDIKCLAKDQKTFGNIENIIKANEMLANVEVDIITLESNNPQIAAECEALYGREKARAELEKLEKEKEQRKQPGAFPANGTLGPPPNLPNIPPQISETTTETGPIHLGESLPGPPSLIMPQTPRQQYNPSQSNGSTVPSRAPIDVTAMPLIGGANSTVFTHIAGPTFTPSGQPPSAARFIMSQRSAIEKIPPGSNPLDFHNSASTTTSGQKTSHESSNRSSSDMHARGKGIAMAGDGSTQDTNGTGVGEEEQFPDFHNLPELSRGSHIPDTQENSKDGSGPRHTQGNATSNSTQLSSPQDLGSGNITFGSSSQFAIVAAAAYPQSSKAGAGGPSSQPTSQPFAKSTLPTAPNTSQPQRSSPPLGAGIGAAPVSDMAPPPRLLLDEQHMFQLHEYLTSVTDGLTVEALEYVTAKAMEVVWQSRTDWDRDGVAEKVRSAVSSGVDEWREGPMGGEMDMDVDGRR